jgi:hypothetical protein
MTFVFSLHDVAVASAPSNGRVKRPRDNNHCPVGIRRLLLARGLLELEFFLVIDASDCRRCISEPSLRLGQMASQKQLR